MLLPPIPIVWQAPETSLDKLVPDVAFRAAIQVHLKALVAAGFSLTPLTRVEQRALTPPYFIQLQAKSPPGNESTVAFFFTGQKADYTTRTDILVRAPRELVERELGTTLARRLPEAAASFYTATERPHNTSIKLSYSLSAQGRFRLVQELENFETARALVQETVSTLRVGTRQQSVVVGPLTDAYQGLMVREVYSLCYDSREAPDDAWLLKVFQKRYHPGGLILEAPSTNQSHWRIRFRIDVPPQLSPAQLQARLQYVAEIADALESELHAKPEDRL